MGSFVEPLHGNDATFELLVNQARILTLKQEITAGPTQPLIAVGDPTILSSSWSAPNNSGSLAGDSA